MAAFCDECWAIVEIDGKERLIECEGKPHCPCDCHK